MDEDFALQEHHVYFTLKDADSVKQALQTLAASSCFAAPRAMVSGRLKATKKRINWDLVWRLCGIPSPDLHAIVHLVKICNRTNLPYNKQDSMPASVRMHGKDGGQHDCLHAASAYGTPTIRGNLNAYEHEQLQSTSRTSKTRDEEERIRKLPRNRDGTHQ